MRTRLTELFGIEHPIIQAPMAGGPSTPELVTAVSQAGGLGCFGFAYTRPDDMRRQVEQVRAATDRPFGINLFVEPEPPEPGDDAKAAAIKALNPWWNDLHVEEPKDVRKPYSPDFTAQVEAVLAIRPAVFTGHFHPLSRDVVTAFQAVGVKVGGSATTVEEARVLAATGVDFVIAQGAEAGGHRGRSLPTEEEGVGTFALTRRIVAAIGERVPVVAAGGIMDGAGVAAALALGADAAQLGTAFVGCPESGAPEPHKQAVLAAGDRPAVMTAAFSGRLARGLVNRFTRGMADAPILPFPIQNKLTAPLRAAGAKAGEGEAMSLWAGQAVGLARGLPAGELVRLIVAETQQAMDRLRTIQDS